MFDGPSAPPTDFAGEVTIRSILETNAARQPDDTLVQFEDGTAWTRSQALDAAAANELRRAGVGPGDRVAVAQPNGSAFLRAWWGAVTLGATIIPVSYSYRGAILEHLLHLAEPRIVIADDNMRARISAGNFAGRMLDDADLRGTDRSAPDLTVPQKRSDAHVYCMTSGTTGPSKLARLSYSQTLSGGDLVFRNWYAASADVFLADLPLFTSNGMYLTHAALSSGCRISVRSRPELGSYWEVARDTGATITQLISTMVSYIENAPPRPAERQHQVRTMMCIPLPGDAGAFKDRFGIQNLHTAWGSTEIPAVICTWPGQKLVAGYCGRLRPGFEVRLVDPFDQEVPDGEAGQAIVRSARPWLISTEYLGNAEATAQAWRNGWCHSGDLLRRDADGNYYFVDRLTDSVRRRGLNISSFEVEQVLLAFPGVAEAACVADRSGVDVEDEVKVWIVTAPGVAVKEEELLIHCAERLPHYMVPRYIELTDALPKGPNGKVLKYALRDTGNSEHTWDRLARGIDVTRHGISRSASPPRCE
jgi:carnitine-CoA ligase